MASGHQSLQGGCRFSRTRGGSQSCHRWVLGAPHQAGLILPCLGAGRVTREVSRAGVRESFTGAIAGFWRGFADVFGAGFSVAPGDSRSVPDVEAATLALGGTGRMGGCFSPRSAGFARAALEAVPGVEPAC